MKTLFLILSLVVLSLTGCNDNTPTTPPPIVATNSVLSPAVGVYTFDMLFVFSSPPSPTTYHQLTNAGAVNLTAGLQPTWRLPKYNRNNPKHLQAQEAAMYDGATISRIR